MRGVGCVMRTRTGMSLISLVFKKMCIFEITSFANIVRLGMNDVWLDMGWIWIKILLFCVEKFVMQLERCLQFVQHLGWL